jgi:hypothetical protein
MGGMANADKILVGRPEGNIPLERSRQNDIKMILMKYVSGLDSPDSRQGLPIACYKQNSLRRLRIT